MIICYTIYIPLFKLLDPLICGNRHFCAHVSLHRCILGCVHMNMHRFSDMYFCICICKFGLKMDRNGVTGNYENLWNTAGGIESRTSGYELKESNTNNIFFNPVKTFNMVLILFSKDDVHGTGLNTEAFSTYLWSLLCLWHLLVLIILFASYLDLSLSPRPTEQTHSLDSHSSRWIQAPAHSLPGIWHM